MLAANPYARELDIPSPITHSGGAHTSPHAHGVGRDRSKPAGKGLRVE